MKWSAHQKSTNENIDRYVRNSNLMVIDNILSESGTVRWKLKNNTLSFSHDTAIYVAVTNGTLTCYSQRDSTEIYNVTGRYYPEIQQFNGTKGIITWEKAGFSRKDVFAEISHYTIDLRKSSFTIDSAKLTYNAFFKKPVPGSLADQAVKITTPDKANFPRFETYEKEFQIKNILKGVNYEGGLKFEGSTVKGTGKRYRSS